MSRFYLKKDGKYLAYRQYEEDAGYIDEYSTEVMQGGFYWTVDIEKAKYFYDKKEIAQFMLRKKGFFWANCEISSI